MVHNTRKKRHLPARNKKTKNKGRRQYVISFRMVFFYLVTTGWIFDISLCENSIKNENCRESAGTGQVHLKVVCMNGHHM